MYLYEVLTVVLRPADGERGSSEIDPLAVAAFVVAVFAAVISGIAMWRTHFSRGKLIWAPGIASLSVSRFRNDGGPSGSGWIVPDLAIPVTIANTGARAVVIRGLRVRVDYPGLPIPDAHEIWELNWELDTETELGSGPRRPSLEARRGPGTPFIVLPKSSIDKRFLFWSRWEKPVVQRLTFTLEVWTSRKPKWRKVEVWEGELRDFDWVGVAKRGYRVGLVPAGQSAARFHKVTTPADLHDYTGPKEPIPEVS
ncbi:hypothetical protein [Agromyces mariniharenae]|uniref:Uncharacterized protein n=1 Tax=Agromyces mariniharenae TaxID=2604423 RepID=A0A5S4UZU6_9MICO|nr:hypothetical protein [Agromyces mariniharenae]TYL51043.1 hypothetical protein FYC51_18095 [Agromyces mariniharenae]